MDNNDKPQWLKEAEERSKKAKEKQDAERKKNNEQTTRSYRLKK